MSGSRMKKVFGFIFFFSLTLLYAQGNKGKNYNAPKDKVMHWIHISEVYSTTQLDSSLYYAHKALREAKGIHNDTLLARVYNNLANAFEYKGNADSAIYFHKKALASRVKIKDKTGIGDSYNNLGVSNDQLGNYDKALQYYFTALKMFESEKNESKQAMVLANIGVVYKESKSYEKALMYYNRAYKKYIYLKDEFGMAVTSGNIGSVLVNLQRYKESVNYSSIAAKGYAKLKYDRYLAYTISNVAIAQDSLQQYNAAERNYLESITLHKKFGNSYEVANILNAYAECLIKQKKYKKSLDISNEALIYIAQTDAGKLKIKTMFNLSKAFAGLGLFEKAYSYAEQYSYSKDTLFESEKTKAIFELETKYETEKKDNELAKERIKVTEHQLQIKHKNTQFYIAVMTSVSFLIIGLLFYNQQKIKNSQLKKEAELSKALLKIETQNKLQDQRLRISRDLHDNIGAQLTFIISSLENLKYLFTIEDERFTKKIAEIGTFARTTITELRDTIWAMNKNEISVEDLKIRISGFIEKAQSSTASIQFNFNTALDVHSIVLTSIEGMNIYRIVQESVHNAIKYAQASIITVYVFKKNDTLCVNVVDNGIGFNPESVKDGNGLQHLKVRAAAIDATVVVLSEKGKGTQILFEKPLV